MEHLNMIGYHMNSVIREHRHQTRINDHRKYDDIDRLFSCDKEKISTES